MPKPKRERPAQRMRVVGSSNVPQDFIEALADFDKQQFVPMETALNETPPVQSASAFPAFDRKVD
jgi:hypothetical protein